jgi:hypothetical protein
VLTFILTPVSSRSLTVSQIPATAAAWRLYKDQSVLTKLVLYSKNDAA